MTSSATDAELIEELRQGNTAAFNELVNRYREKIYWVARRMVGSHADADDVVQETFVRAYEHLAAFRAESSVYTWLYRIAVNVSLNTIRKNKVRNFVPVDAVLETLAGAEPPTDAEVLKKEYETLLEKAVATLPEKQKLVFMMKFYDEISFEEMAKMLNKSVGGLKANYFHAVQKIQRFVRKELGS